MFTSLRVYACLNQRAAINFLRYSLHSKKQNMQAIRFFLALLFIVATANSLSAQQLPLRKQSLDNDWTFAFGNANDPSKDFNYSLHTIFSKSGVGNGTPADVNFNDSAWRKLNLPHDWVVELPFENNPGGDLVSHGYKTVGGLYPATSIGWYRKHFTVPVKDSG